MASRTPLWHPRLQVRPHCGGEHCEYVIGEKVNEFGGVTGGVDLAIRIEAELHSLVAILDEAISHRLRAAVVHRRPDFAREQRPIQVGEPRRHRQERIRDQLRP